MNTYERIILKVREDNPTKLIEMKIETTGTAQDEPVFFISQTNTDYRKRNVLAEKKHGVPY